MIKATVRAVEELERILAANDAPEDRGVKLVPEEKGQIGVVIDHVREGDDVLKRDERPLLMVDAALAPKLDGAEVDVSEPAEGGGGPQLILRMPERQ